MSEETLFCNKLNPQGTLIAKMVQTEAGWYQVQIGEQILTPQEVSQLCAILEAHQDALVMANGQNKIQQKNADALPEKRQEFYKVEYDLNFFGGSYGSMNSQDAYIPCALVHQYGMDRAFQMKTGYSPANIVYYNESETFTLEEVIAFRRGIRQFRLKK